MRALPVARSLAALAGAALAAFASGAAGADGDVLEVELRHPPARSEVDSGKDAFVAGSAFVRLSAENGVDVVIAIDTSTSAGADMGVDLDGDGRVETRFAGPDSVLTAEIRAADECLQLFEGAGVRAGLVRFAGDPASYPGIPQYFEPPPEATIVSEVTDDVASVRRRLAGLAQPEPAGRTNFVAALEHAWEAFPARRGKRHRAVMLLTDGTATGPAATPAENVDATLAAMRRFVDAGVQVHTFAIGTGALANPVLVMQMADMTGGFFTPVENLAELVELARRVAATNVADVSVRNRTTGQAARNLYLSRDGEFGADVPVRAGENVIQVTAAARGGATRTREIVVVGRPGARAPRVPPGLRELEKGVMAERLDRLRERTEQLREKLRQQMVVEMERQRERTRQRKELELRVQKERPERAPRADAP
ncbi:MAG: hypothetical protein DCC71_03355 [Proteobacteria bacterium]|nr:MAG: hypothetical protein DCC71_03355 [Pseudomonadota bacterium]